MRRRRPSVALEYAAAFLTWVAVLIVVLWFRGKPQGKVPLEPRSACSKDYAELFSSDPIEIRIVFGYKDARPARFVADRYERVLLVERLLAPCSKPGDLACGFERSNDDADLFTRLVTGPEGLPRAVSLRVAHSSVGPDDVSNREDPFQKWQSEYARKEWVDALSTAQVALYNGHSRSGGGPDFDPPVLDGSKHADYGWYRRAEPGLKLSEKALRSSGSLRLLGLYSCASDRLFRKRLSDARKGLGVIASDRLLYFSEALEGLTETLSGILGMKCRPELEHAIDSHSARAGTKITGFFPGSKRD